MKSEERKTVLVVDKHPTVRLALGKRLELMPGVGHILEASDAVDALRCALMARPHLVVLDLDLPPMSGLDLVAQLRRALSTVHIAVVSAMDTRVFAARAMAAGAHGFVSKSRSVDEIMKCLGMVMAGFWIIPVEAAGPNASTLVLHRDTGEAARFETLSGRERLVMIHLVKGEANHVVARELHMSPKTVSSHKVSLMKKLGVSNVVELLDLARHLHIATRPAGVVPGSEGATGDTRETAARIKPGSEGAR